MSGFCNCHPSVRLSEEEEKEKEEFYICCCRNSEDSEEFPSGAEQQAESEELRTLPSDYYDHTNAATLGDLGVKTSSPHDPLIPQVTPTGVGAQRGEQNGLTNRIRSDSIAFTGAHQSSEQELDNGRNFQKKVSSMRQNNDFLKITKTVKTNKFGTSSVSFSCENSKPEIGSGINSGIVHGKIDELFGTNSTDDGTTNEETKSSLVNAFILPSTMLLWQWILSLKNIPTKNQRNIPEEISSDNTKNILQCDDLSTRKFPIYFLNNYPDRENSHTDEDSIEDNYSQNRNSHHTGMTIDMKNCRMKTKIKMRRESSPQTLGYHWWDGTSDADTADDADESDSNFDSLQYGRVNTQSNAESRFQVPAEKVCTVSFFKNKFLYSAKLLISSMIAMTLILPALHLSLPIDSADIYPTDCLFHSSCLIFCPASSLFIFLGPPPVWTRVSHSVCAPRYRHVRDRVSRRQVGPKSKCQDFMLISLFQISLIASQNS
jgi:hypothetical protein